MGNGEMLYVLGAIDLILGSGFALIASYISYKTYGLLFK